MEDLIYGKEKMLPRVTAVETMTDHLLMLTFDNGEKRIFDAKYLMNVSAYRSLANVFDKAEVSYGTVVWPGDIDISPETLYLRSTRADQWQTSLVKGEQQQ